MSIKRRIWNLRFAIGWRILPGQHKHVSARTWDEPCDHQFCKGYFA